MTPGGLARQSGLERVAVEEPLRSRAWTAIAELIGVSAGAVSRGFVGFTALTVAAAAGSLAALALTVGWHVGAPGRFWLLALFVLAGELLPIPVPRRHGLDKVAVSTAFAFAALLCAGVLAACVVYAAASAIADLSARTAPIKVLFNSAQYVLSLAGAGVVLDRRRGRPACHAAHERGGGDPARRAGVFRDRSRAGGDGRRAAGRPADRALPGRRPRVSRA